MELRKLQIIDIEWNGWNGFVFALFSIECDFKNHTFDGDLLGLYIGTDHFIIHFMFIEFEIKSPIF